MRIRPQAVPKRIGDVTIVVNVERMLSCSSCDSWQITAAQLGEVELEACRAALSDASLDLHGDAMKTVRKILGLRQADLAGLFDVAAETICRAETSGSPLTWQLRYALLGVVEIALRDDLVRTCRERGVEAAA